MSSESARISVKRTTIDLIVPIAESMGITVTEYINNVLLDNALHVSSLLDCTKQDVKYPFVCGDG